jgi:hypothetical protein
VPVIAIHGEIFHEFDDAAAKCLTARQFSGTILLGNGPIV